jgi:hypothetical protein
MPIIKFSTPWSHIDFNTRISYENPNAEYIFDFENKYNYCDYWIIWGGIKNAYEKALCPSQNVVFITEEVHGNRNYNQRFLDQFASVITNRKDITHRNNIFVEHELNTWLVNRDFDFLAKNNFNKKEKLLSVVCSDQTWLPGHKLRFAFVNKLIGHFKDKIDVFGRGFNPIDDKFDALAPYKYSVSIENNCIPGYFTEKLTDCLLTNTMPIYYGCPDLENYFNVKSFEYIDPLDYLGSIKKIEKLIEEDYYSKAASFIELEKIKYLNQYHIFNKLPQIIESNFQFSQKRNRINIKNEHLFNRESSFKKIISKIKI